MNLNKIGMNVKKNINGALSTLLGIITNSENKHLRLHREVKLTEKIYFERELDRILLETEAKKNQAAITIRDAQNC